ncbi:MAG TPA: GNAT family N-acetyltransferase [Balneola sp.]|jgi:GNAT superfamily N-acetyltransferase|nr:GNAT family N-acetyltransferase [Balneola sp.]MAO77961.1 GNAT family N-acetyltransferase [Balneola sp.]MBF65248.1 GNAT family N-acetyltransferase [Balneola sp.]HAH51714.1 GNAT family N-acetyltransferase [Balneola sp.]HBZ37804.1 GNAT family N-acetyltransferase [Balneola sp.]|tara:strand:+ start:669 stop:1313 length:645 start_codon:yes stop_codon:yes gene_type:complete
MSVSIYFGSSKHAVYAEEICALIEKAAQQRGTGIAKRDPNYIKTKFENQNAVIALDGDKLVGFCYIEIWESKKYVANSGLVVHPDYRGLGLAKKIKGKAFELSKKKYPTAKLFGITTSLPVMKINSGLGYKPVTFSELTQDETFWNGCQSCPNYDILSRNDRKNCLCTGMLYDPQHPNNKPKEEREANVRKFYRWVQMKTASVQKLIKPLKIFL